MCAFFSRKPPSSLSLDEIRRDVRSDNREVRLRAVLLLFQLAKNDVAVHQEASLIFSKVLENSDEEPAIAATAVQGIELAAGSAEARHYWVRLLQHPRVAVAVYAAMAITDPAYVPILIELLAKRPETYFHIGVISTLGRLRDPSAFSVIAEHFAAPETRICAIEALANFGDLRAIPLLEPLLQDTSEMPEPDERGAVRRMCEVADEAIRRIRRRPMA